MEVNINQIICNILNEDRTIKRSSKRESYILYPASGKVLRNIITGEIVKDMISVQTKKEIADYEEIELHEDELIIK